MSLSFPKRASAAAALGLLAAPAIWAQQQYFIPGVEVSAENYTNRSLAPDSVDVESSQTYKAILEARMGLATPRSNTEFRPRILVQEISNRSGVDRTEAFADLSTRYRLPRGQLALVGSYARQDDLNAEFGRADFPDFNPDEPPPPDIPAPVIISGLTRTKYELEPSFTHQLTQRIQLGGLLDYESVRFDPNIPGGRVGYDAPYAELTLYRTMGQRTQLGFGPYISRYEPDSNGPTTDTYGALIGIRHEWSEVSRVEAQLRGERNETDAVLPGLEGQSSTDWGIEFIGRRKGPASALYYSIGRFLRPSSQGSRRSADQVQLQYDRRMSERIKLKTAVRFLRDGSLGDSSFDPGDRNRARFEIGLTRLLTQEWSLTGGYRFAWQDLGDNVDSANNHTVFISVGFRGRDPRREGRDEVGVR